MIFFLILAPKNGSYGAERHRIVFLRPLETFWSLNRGSTLLRYEVIGQLAFWPFLGHWPDLRGHRLI